MPSIVSGPFGFRRKFEASCHLLANLNYLCVTALCLCLPMLILSNREDILFSQIGHRLFLIGALCFGLFYIGSQFKQQPLYRACLLLPVVFAVGLGLCINNTRAVVEALVRHTSPFVRTPKRGADGNTSSQEVFYKVPTSTLITLIETILFAIYVICLIHCVRHQQWHHLPLISLFCAAFSANLWTKIPWINRPPAAMDRT